MRSPTEGVDETLMAFEGAYRDHWHTCIDDDDFVGVDLKSCDVIRDLVVPLKS